MIDFLKYRIPVRVRLTLWYVFLMALTFTALVIYLTVRFQISLRNSIDQSLQQTVSKTIASLDQSNFRETDGLSFDIVEKSSINSAGFAIRLVSEQGTVWDIFGEAQNLSNWGLENEGFSTQQGRGDEDDQWRVLSQPVLGPNGNIIGWVQAAQSLANINETIYDLQEQVFLGIPVILIFAGLGGYFLADRALRPIKQITITAQQITARDLSRRLEYIGPQDEIGNLAETFDQMIGRLQSSFERERRFTGDAAHELRTPLTILKGQIDVTLSRPRNSAEYEKKLQELSVQVDRLIRLSNALLFLSRSDQNQIAFHPTSINLRELLDALIEQLHPLAEEKNLNLLMQISDDIFVCGDSDYLIRLFMNLLENALKYTPVNGRVTVSAVKESDEIRIAIHNSGAGISQEHLEHLFERFYRIDADRSSQTGGSGLGLAIAHEIVHMHAGEISVASEPGKGVKFTVYLPDSAD